MSKPVLYSYYRSSASWRVRIVLAHKKIEYDSNYVHLIKNGGEQNSEKYRAINKLSQVPTLVIDSQTLTQSLPIIEYLEETRPDNPILPRDPILRCKARELAEIVNSGTQPLINLSTVNKLEEVCGVKEERTPWAQHWITKGLTAFEHVVSGTAGRYCVGDEVSIADVALIPQLLSAERNGVSLQQFPTICRVVDECSKLQAFKQAHPDNQPDNPQK